MRATPCGMSAMAVLNDSYRGGSPSLPGRKRKSATGPRAKINSAVSALIGTEAVPGIVAVALRFYLVERKSAIGPIRHFDWDGPQRRQLFVQWTIRFVRVREPHRRGRNR